MPRPSPTGLCQVNLNDQNTRVVVCVENDDPTAPSAAPAVEKEDIEISIDDAESPPSAIPIATDSLHSELQQLGLRELCARAADVGVDAAAVEVARDHDEPNRELIALIVDAEASRLSTRTEDSQSDSEQDDSETRALQDASAPPGFSADESQVPQDAPVPPGFDADEAQQQPLLPPPTSAPPPAAQPAQPTVQSLQVTVPFGTQHSFDVHICDSMLPLWLLLVH